MKSKASEHKKLTNYELYPLAVSSVNLYQEQKTKSKNFNFVHLLSFFLLSPISITRKLYGVCE